MTSSTLPTRPIRRYRRMPLLTLSIARRTWRGADRDDRHFALESLRALLRDLERGYTPRQAVERAYGRRRGAR